jgi:hypothetical protein
VGNPYAPPPASGPPPQNGPGTTDPTRERQRPWPGGVPPEAPRPPGPPSTGRGRRTEPSGRPPSPEEVRTAGRRALAATGLTFGALITSAMPLPWQALSGAFALAAVVAGVRALRTARATGLRRSLMPVVTISLALGAFYLVSSIGVVMTWSIQQEHQDCLARALTVSAQDACEADFRQALERFRSGAP